MKSGKPFISLCLRLADRQGVLRFQFGRCAALFSNYGLTLISGTGLKAGHLNLRTLHGASRRANIRQRVRRARQRVHGVEVLKQGAKPGVGLAAEKCYAFQN